MSNIRHRAPSSASLGITESRSRRARAGAFTALALVILVTSCTDTSPAFTTTTSTTAPTNTTEAKADVVIDVSVHPGTAAGFEGARSDVTDHECRVEHPGWVSSGTVTNPGDRTYSYRIYTSYLDAHGRTVGLLQTDVDNVAPGASEAWSGYLDLPSRDVSCSLRVERTPSD